MIELQTNSFVFLSYAHTNEEIVSRIVADLRRYGISVWIDHSGILPGTNDWEHTIRKAISTAKAIVLVASPASSSSLIVRDELQLADKYNCPIYPIWIEGEHWIDAVPLGRGSIQYIDLRGSSYEKGLSKLVETLKNILSVPSLAVPSQYQENEVRPALLPLPILGAKQVTANQKTIENVPEVSYMDWGDAPDVPIFFGRKKELGILEQWIIKERCRLVAIVGMPGIGKTQLSLKLRQNNARKAKSSVKLGKGGIGKTDLTLRLAKEIQNQFEYVIWRRLLNAPKVTDILADLIRVLSNQQEINLPDTVEEQVSRLLFYLRRHRSLLILDNAETILEGGTIGQYRAGYEDYGQLFRQIAEVPHESCMLLTSREKPQDIVLLEGSSRPVRSLELGGLDYENSKKIFATVGQFQGSEKDWQELIGFYNGNPLALELAAKHIQNVFAGNISAFLKEHKQIFFDLRSLLDWYFTRLDNYEKEVMYWLAINREPMSMADLREDLLSSKSKLLVSNTLDLLQRLIPLDKTTDRFTLQPVLMEYMIERFIDEIIEEVEQEKIDLFNTYALKKALAKDYVRDIQTRLILQPVLEHFLTSGKTNCEQKFKTMLQLLHENSSIQRGYAAGNILNCLIHINADLRDMDFSHLPVWQAYLREASMIGVNFAYGDLTKSVFTDIFGNVLSVAFSPDGTKIAAGTNTGEIRVWQVSNGAPLYTLTEHTDWVWALAFSPDGRVLASGSSDRTIRLWDVANEQCIQVLHAHTHRIRCVTFSKDGNKLASASEDKSILIWSADTGEVLHTLIGHTNPVRAIAFTPDGERLVSGSDDNSIRIWDIHTEQCSKILQGHTSQIWSLALSDDGNIIASGSDDRTVRIWDIHTGRCLRVLYGHTNWVCSLAFAPDCAILASGSADSTIRIWNVHTGQPLETLQGHKNWINSVNFSSDGKILASGSHDQTVRIWDVSTGHCLMTLQGYSNAVHAVTFSPCENVLASGDRTVHIWDTQTGQSKVTLQGHSTWIRALVFSSDGTLLASGSDDQTARIWKIRTAQPFHTLKGHTNRVKSLAFSSNGRLLVTGSDDHTVRLWDVQTGKQLRVLHKHTNRIRSVAFSPTNTVFASGGDDWMARIWDTQSDQPIYELKGHINRIWSIAFSPNGEILATGSEDSSIRLWQVNTGQCLYILQGHINPVWCIAFHPNGLMLASSSEDRTIRLWDVNTGQCLHVLQGHTNPIWTVSFSNDGNLVASGSHDNTVQLWNSSSGENLTVLREHTEPVWALSFSPDNSTLASCSDDGTCILWDIQQKKLRNILRGERPYERMNITSITGQTESQKAILRALGAFEDEM